VNIDQSVTASPILRIVPFLNSGAFSPWPARLMAMEDWQKPERNEEERCVKLKGVAFWSTI